MRVIILDSYLGPVEVNNVSFVQAFPALDSELNMSLKRSLTFGISAFFGLFVLIPLMGSSCDDNVDCILPLGGSFRVPDSAAGRLQCLAAQNAQIANQNAAVTQLSKRPSKSSSGP